MKKLCVVALASLLLPLSALANPLDVPSGAWYSSTVEAFVDAGYFDQTQLFRPTEKATRAEFIQLMVNLKGGVTHTPFTIQSFDDVSPNNPFFNYFEEAGLAGWIKGTGSCYGTHPCMANPNSPINRAEAATLIIRALNLQMGDKAPSFSDNPTYQWFTVPINTAASLCILQGDTGGKQVRPSDHMNRAEMITMLKRALAGIRYPNCAIEGSFTLPNEKNDASQQPSRSSTASPTQAPTCLNDAWVCDTWGPCGSDSYQHRHCNLDIQKTSSCLMNPGPPMPSVEQTCVPSSSAISSVSNQPDIVFNATIAAYLAKTDGNIGNMKQQADLYESYSNTALAAQTIRAWIFTYTGDLAKLKTYAKVADTRTLAPEELSAVTALLTEMNSIVSSYNKLVDNKSGN